MPDETIAFRAMLASQAASSLALAALSGRTFPHNVSVRLDAFLSAMKAALQNDEAFFADDKEELRREIEAVIRSTSLFKRDHGAHHLSDEGVAIQMRLIDGGFSDQEIADMMRITSSAVAQRRAALTRERAEMTLSK